MSEKDEDAGTISGFINSLKSSGEAAFEELSSQLLENQLFLAAMRRTLEAKASVDSAIGGTLDFVSLPSKNDFAALREEVDQLRQRVAKQQRSLKGIESTLQEIKELLGRDDSR